MEREEARTKAKDLYDRGVEAFRHGDQDVSRTLNEQALEIGEQHDDPLSMVRGLIGLARIAFRNEDHPGLREVCERALPLWSALPLVERSAVTSPIHMLAESARLDGDLDRARSLYAQSIAVSREAGDARFEAVELLNSSFLEIQAGDFAKSKELARGSVSTVVPDENDAPYVLLALGSIAAGEGQGERAVTSLARAQDLMAASGNIFDPGDKPLFDAAVARAKVLLGEEFEALWEAGRMHTTDQAIEQGLSD